ncbi:MAG: hypothetical protein HY720_19620 [Planctomycetes bacterium]|nr:hypothetical protein [Planctomycetota bacterium]
MIGWRALQAATEALRILHAQAAAMSREARIIAMTAAPLVLGVAVVLILLLGLGVDVLPGALLSAAVIALYYALAIIPARISEATLDRWKAGAEAGISRWRAAAPEREAMREARAAERLREREARRAERAQARMERAQERERAREVTALQRENECLRQEVAARDDQARQAEAERHARMSGKPPTERQLDFLEDLGYEGPDPATCLEASETIDAMLARQKNRE